MVTEPIAQGDAVTEGRFGALQSAPVDDDVECGTEDADDELCEVAQDQSRAIRAAALRQCSGNGLADQRRMTLKQRQRLGGQKSPESDQSPPAGLDHIGNVAAFAKVIHYPFAFAGHLRPS